MGRLYFSARARARARERLRRRRITTALAVVSMAAVVAGIPGSDAGLVLIRDLADSGALSADATLVETSESAASTLRFRRGLFGARPEPTPSPEPDPERAETTEAASATDVAAAAPAGSIAEIIYAAAAEFGIDGGYLLSVADCESSLNPSAQNAAGYYGLFQFDQQTWAAYGYGSIYDPTAQSRTAARLLAAGQYSRWPNCA